MNTCASMISPDCRGDISKRGICSSCYKLLLEEGFITVSGVYPEWLEEMIRLQRNFDEYHEGKEDSLNEAQEKELV